MFKNFKTNHKNPLEDYQLGKYVNIKDPLLQKNSSLHRHYGDFSGSTADSQREKKDKKPQKKPTFVLKPVLFSIDDPFLDLRVDAKNCR